VKLARAHSKAPIVTYAVRSDADYHASGLTFGPDGAHFTIEGRETTDVLLPMSGYHNVENAVGVYAAARSLGLSPNEITDALASFRGVKRRQEPRGEIGGVLVIDDFAHHPTAVRETIEGIRQRYPDRRLWAVFEPRSNTSRRNIHQAEYAESFEHADVVTIRVPEAHDKVPAGQQLNVHAIVQELSARGITANALADVADITRFLANESRANDLVLVMSNGSFGGLIPSLLVALEQRTRGMQ
jgi:UDP-N-acetylmuramate: L-alanyl-gamma-D-glutamyl-meso-diaminopimelate ligase